MSNSFLFPVASVEGTHFTEALAAAAGTGVGPFVASALYNIPGVPPIGSRSFLIRAIKVIAMQNVGLEFDFFSSAVAVTGDPATDKFISKWGFTSAMGEQFGGAGLWRYYIDGLAIPYVDTDAFNNVASPTLHVVALNIDTVAKSAGAAGQFVATFHLEPMQAY